MKFICNQQQWMKDQKIMEHLTSRTGERAPIYNPDLFMDPFFDEYRAITEPLYSHDRCWYHFFGPASEDMKDFSFDLPPMPDTRTNSSWWFVKLYPGEFQPMHLDPHTLHIKNLLRYTIFLNDWEPGHIFVYDDKYISNYKAGDMFEWSDPMTLHGPINIGYNTRYTMQITLWD